MKNNRQLNSRWRMQVVGALLIGWTGLSVLSAAAAEQVDARITYRIADGVYVDIGTEQGLQQGLRGNLVLDDGRTFTFEVQQAASRTALLGLNGPGSGMVGSAGGVPVRLMFDLPSTADPAGTSAATSPAAAQEAEPFVPLLAPLEKQAEGSRSGNIGHGSIGVRQAVQTGTDNDLDRMSTRFDTAGSIERLYGSLWSFTWSGQARYRTGDAYRTHPEYETVQPLIYSFMLQHPLDQGGFIRLGRFLPLELPGVGYVDGLQLETDPDNPWRFGLISGLKPDRIDLSVTADEPTVTGYATLEAGTRGSAYYSGTAGLLASSYRGDIDRLAVLFDQRADIGPRMNLFSTAEYDFGIADTTNSQAQLTRFDLTASYRIFSAHTLRAGADHWQRIDILAVRDQLGFTDDQLFDDGYWRYWVGGNHRLPWNLSLNEEVAYTVSDTTEDAMRWRVGMTRSGLARWTAATLSATVYNLEAMGASGYGGLLSGYLPFWNGRMAVRPSASLRWLEPDNGADELSVTYYSVYVDARLNRTWLLTGGLSQSLGDGADAIQGDLGLRYSW